MKSIKFLKNKSVAKKAALLLNIVSLSVTQVFDSKRKFSAENAQNTILEHYAVLSHSISACVINIQGMS